jgi:ABC-type sugar transport system permease subunit
LNWNGGPLSQAQFIGLDNFRQLFSDPYLPPALVNNLRVLFLSWAFQLPLALLLAFAIVRLRRGGSVYRFLFIIPYIIPAATLALVWGFVFSGETYGELNSLLNFLGLGGLIQNWLSADGVVQWVTSFPQVMVYVGFFMIIFIAALVGIPKEYYEAADMDGAGAWQQLIFITLPSIRAIYLSSLILSLQLSLSAFIYPYLMTQGGPLHISETPVSYSLYLLYSQQEWGYASAVNVLIFILGVVAVTLLWRAGRVRTE